MKNIRKTLERQGSRTSVNLKHFVNIFSPQGKRVAGEGEAHMSDMYHENTMLQTENDK